MQGILCPLFCYKVAINVQLSFFLCSVSELLLSQGKMAVLSHTHIELLSALTTPPFCSDWKSKRISNRGGSASDKRPPPAMLWGSFCPAQSRGTQTEVGC